MDQHLQRRITIFLAGSILGCVILLFIVSQKSAQYQAMRQADPSRVEALPPDYYPLSMTDEQGHEITLYRQVDEIVSLAPSITEILFAMEADDLLQAVTDYCDYPAEARLLPRIGRLDAPDRERLMDIFPDLVLGTDLTPAHVYEQFDALRLGYAVFKHDSMDDVLLDILDMGKLAGRPETARRLVHRLKDEIREINERIRKLNTSAPVRAVILYDLRGLYSAGGGTWPDQMITACGGVNLAADAPSSWPQLSLESLVALDPEVIIVPVQLHDPEAVRAMEAAIDGIRKEPAWASVSAVRDNRFALVEDSLLSIPGPRMTKAMRAIAGALYPDSFAPVTVSPAGNATD